MSERETVVALPWAVHLDGGEELVGVGDSAAQQLAQQHGETEDVRLGRVALVRDHLRWVRGLKRLAYYFGSHNRAGVAEIRGHQHHDVFHGISVDANCVIS